MQDLNSQCFGCESKTSNRCTTQATITLIMNGLFDKTKAVNEIKVTLLVIQTSQSPTKI